MDYSVVFEGVNFFYEKKQALYDINLAIAPGTIFGLLGPSGCGKTTLVKIAAGIHRAASGRVLVLGGSMPDLGLMQRIGYMAQSDALYPALNAMDNLRFFGAIYGMTRKETDRRAAELLALVNLSGDAKKPLGAYSGGMKRRFSLALALLCAPPLLILDEPTVGIDPILRRDIWKRIGALVKNGSTVLVTTHVMDEAERCDKLAMMRTGRFIRQEKPETLIAESGKSTMEEAFIYYIEEANRG
jgi:ABC-2 type transport system ATP-binding protein